MSRISIILNVDTRPVCGQFQGMWNGVRSRDFISVHNLVNKRRFFEGYDTELCVFVDEHEPLTQAEYTVLHDNADCVVVRKHSKYYRGADPFNAFNDVNYWQALSMARGTHIAHFDQDVVAFRADNTPVVQMMDEVDSGRHAFVCYPSPQSPNPCEAPQYGGKFWASTRFFLCKRETLILDDLERAIRDNSWFYAKYGMPAVVNPWTESFIAQMANNSVLYPTVELDRWAVFPWQKYVDGTLEKLNNMPYHAISDAIRRAGGQGIFWDGADSTLMGI